MTLIADNPAVPHVKRWTKQEYFELVEKGFLYGQSTYLFRGELVNKRFNALPAPKEWSKKEFIESVERGFFTNQRLILFRGELIEMPAIGALHALAAKNLNIWLVQSFQGEFEVRTQNPFEAHDQTMPQPDGAVYTQAQDQRRPHPNAALLIIEISDSSLEFDREMAADYAASHVDEYWIINVRDRNAEVYRNAVSDPASPTGFSYATRAEIGEAEIIAPLFKPGVKVAVAAFLTPAR
jgi:Uma2 family endonuclease